MQVCQCGKTPITLGVLVNEGGYIGQLVCSTRDVAGEQHQAVAAQHLGHGVQIWRVQADAQVALAVLHLAMRWAAFGLRALLWGCAIVDACAVRAITVVCGQFTLEAHSDCALHMYS